MFTFKKILFPFLVVTALSFVPTHTFAGMFDKSTEPPKESVKIDVKPNAENKDINLKKDRVFEVAIIGSKDFDVKQVDLKSVTLNDTKGESEFNIKDVNEDGTQDLVLTFASAKFNFDGEKELKVKGMTKDGKFFEGSESVTFIK